MTTLMTQAKVIFSDDEMVPMYSKKQDKDTIVIEGLTLKSRLRRAASVFFEQADHRGKRRNTRTAPDFAAAGNVANIRAV